MTFRARLFIAIFFFSVLPLAYIMGAGQFATPFFLVPVFALCVFVLIGALAGSVKVDEIVKASENRAIGSEVSLQLFMERVHDGVFHVDPEGKILEINTAMAQLLRYPPDFLKGRRLWDYLESSRGVPDESLFQAAQVRTTARMTGKVKTGESITLLVDFYLQKQEDKFVGLRGCARLAERALEEETLRERLALDLFQILRKRLQGGLTEIRMAADPGQDPTASQAALEAAAGRLLCALPPCFEEGLISSWRPKLQLGSVPPKVILENVQAKFGLLAQRHSQTLSVECFGEPLPFLGDPDYLTELLGNLVDNALKYSPNDSEIHLLYREDDSGRNFVVWDNGVGMSREEVSRLFVPFFRSDNPTNRRIPGLGLGVWMAQRIAEAHKGMLLAQSDLGKGTTFTLKLPKSDQTQKNIAWID